MLSLRSVNQFYGQNHPVGHQPGAAARRPVAPVLLGRNGVGKTTLVRLHHGACAGGERQHCNLGSQRISRRKIAAAADGTRRLGHQPLAGQAILQLSVGESAGGANGQARRPSPHSAADLQPISPFAPDARAGGDLCVEALSATGYRSGAGSRTRLLLILDNEPTAGVPPSAPPTSALIRRLQPRLGMTTILLVGHQLPFVRRVADALPVGLALFGARRAGAQLDEALIGAGLAGARKEG